MPGDCGGHDGSVTGCGPCVDCGRIADGYDVTPIYSRDTGTIRCVQCADASDRQARYDRLVLDRVGDSASRPISTRNLKKINAWRESEGMPIIDASGEEVTP